MKKIIENILLIICLSVFFLCVYKIYNYYKEEKQQEKLNSSLSKIAVNEIPSDNEGQRGRNKEDVCNSQQIEIDFEALKKENKDIIGWLYSEGTPINYPIVQTDNNDYYLRRLVDGSYNRAGTIFVDYRNKNNFGDFNTIMYGHNMKNETMFGTLLNYNKQEYYEKHKILKLFTENKDFNIVIFAGCLTSSKSEIYDYPKTINSNKKLIEFSKMKNDIKTDIKVNEDDKIITLSTCSYSFKNARYVILGILKEINNDE